MDLSKFWNNNVPKVHKHFINEMLEEKIKMYVIRSKKNLLNFIGFSKSKNDIILDWGCGGGLLTNILFNYGKVIILDISQNSLDTCKSFINNVLYDTILFPNNPEHFKISKYNINLIWSCAVIHHFPSFNYWLEIVNIRNQISPHYIAIQVKLGDKPEYKENYFEKGNYINGLILSPQNIYEAFPSYTCVSFIKEKAKYSNSMLGFFVLKKETTKC